MVHSYILGRNKGRFFTYQITNIMEITLYLNLTLTLTQVNSKDTLKVFIFGFYAKQFGRISAFNEFSFARRRKLKTNLVPTTNTKCS